MDINKLIDRLKQQGFESTPPEKEFSFQTELEAKKFMEEFVREKREAGFYIKDSVYGKGTFNKKDDKSVYELFPKNHTINYFYRTSMSLKLYNEEKPYIVSIYKIFINKLIVAAETDDLNLFKKYLPRNRNEKMISFAYATAKHYDSKSIIAYIFELGLLDEFDIKH